MIVSTFFIAAGGTWVTEKIVIPRLGEYTGDEKPEEIRNLTQEERRGCSFAVIATVLAFIVIMWGLIPADGFLRNPQIPENIWKSTFISGIVAFIFLLAALLGIAYGLGAGTIKNDSQVMKGMGKSMEALGIYMVLCFFAAQFVAYFKWTNLGLIIAIEGAAVLQELNPPPFILMIGFIFLVAVSNLFMGSASAKWAILAPVFIPMLMLSGFSPELTQVGYRIGDSTTNIISPMMSYFALIVAFVDRYTERSGIGTVVATMLPYTIVFLIIWTILLIVWMQLGLPLGPDSNLFLN